MNQTDLFPGEEEVPPEEIRLQAEAYIRAIKPLVEKCETDRNSTKQKGLVTGLAFRKKSRILHLPWNNIPQASSRQKKEKTDTEEMYHVPSPCCCFVNTHLFNLGLMTKGAPWGRVHSAVA